VSFVRNLRGFETRFLIIVLLSFKLKELQELVWRSGWELTLGRVFRIRVDFRKSREVFIIACRALGEVVAASLLPTVCSWQAG
jgi:hypothetical protein